MYLWNRDKLIFVSASLFSAGYVAQTILSFIFPIPVTYFESFFPGAPWYATLIAFLLPSLGLITFLVSIFRMNNKHSRLTEAF